MTIAPLRGSRETLQVRRNTSTPLAVRAGVKNPKTGATGLVELKGCVIAYSTPYQVYDGHGSGSFSETIHPGTCRDLLASPNLDACFLVGHDNKMIPLARTGAKAALTMAEDRNGLQIKALVDPRMNATSELLLGLELGTISQLSVGMEVDPEHDVWSGSDAYGMPNIRNIHRLKAVHDVSAVSFPANHATALEVASAALRAFRNAPTSQDPHITKAIVHAHKATAAALAAQSSDPDNNSDPADKQVWKALATAHAHLTTALQHQALDGTPDIPGDGTNGGGGGNTPSIGSADGTGSRHARVLQMIEDDQMEFADGRIEQIRARAEIDELDRRLAIDKTRRLLGLPPVYGY